MIAPAPRAANRAGVLPARWDTTAQLPDCGYLPRPFLEWACGCTAHTGAGFDVVFDMRHASNLCATSDFHVTNHPRLGAHHDEIPELCGPSDPALCNDDAMSADHDVVGNLHQIVDLGPLPDGCI